MSHIAFQKSTAGHKTETEMKTDVKLHEQNTREGWRTWSVNLKTYQNKKKKKQSNSTGLRNSSYWNKQTNKKPQKKNPHHFKILKAFMGCCSSGRLENLEHCQVPATLSGVTPNFPWLGMPAHAHPLDLKCAGTTFMGTHMQWLLKLCTHLNGKGKGSSSYQNSKPWRWHKYC